MHIICIYIYNIVHVVHFNRSMLYACRDRSQGMSAFKVSKLPYCRVETRLSRR